MVAPAAVLQSSSPTPSKPQQQSAADAVHAAANAPAPHEPPRDTKDVVELDNDLVAAYVRGAGAALASGARAISSVRLLAVRLRFALAPSQFLGVHVPRVVYVECVGPYLPHVLLPD